MWVPTANWQHEPGIGPQADTWWLRHASCPWGPHSPARGQTSEQIITIKCWPIAISRDIVEVGIKYLQNVDKESLARNILKVLGLKEQTLECKKKGHFPANFGVSEAPMMKTASSSNPAFLSRLNCSPSVSHFSSKTFHSPGCLPHLASRATLDIVLASRGEQGYINGRMLSWHPRIFAVTKRPRKQSLKNNIKLGDLAHILYLGQICCLGLIWVLSPGTNADHDPALRASLCCRAYVYDLQNVYCCCAAIISSNEPTNDPPAIRTRKPGTCRGRKDHPQTLGHSWAQAAVEIWVDGASKGNGLSPSSGWRMATGGHHRARQMPEAHSLIVRTNHSGPGR